MNYFHEDFTENFYREILRLAKLKFSFIDYASYKTIGRNVLWRHDIDLSPQRARRIAQIEADEGVKATYFIHLHSEFYNALETDVLNCVREIIHLGHQIGLHFDPGYYALSADEIDVLERSLLFEKYILENTLNVGIKAFSYHNPTAGTWLSAEQENIAGMINAYSQYIKENYQYCSDSNGYWRFRRLYDVITDESIQRLQVLTHPGWWTPTIMSPRERISRCIDGRSMKLHKAYDDLLQRMGRTNVK
jgi:hypothetical protein